MGCVHSSIETRPTAISSVLSKKKELTKCTLQIISQNVLSKCNVRLYSQVVLSIFSLFTLAGKKIENCFTTVLNTDRTIESPAQDSKKTKIKNKGGKKI